MVFYNPTSNSPTKEKKESIKKPEGPLIIPKFLVKT